MTDIVEITVAVGSGRQGDAPRMTERHVEKAFLHVFPRVPVAVAVELGRILMPKADRPLRVYDQNVATGGFFHALSIDPGSGPEGRTL